MTNNRTLYKYRDFKGEGFKRFVDIILNERLYACSYEKLRENGNDTEEGSYYHIITDKEVVEIFTQEVYSQKSRLKICSLSDECNSEEMWEEYAEGYKGVIVAVEVDANKCRRINYVNDFPLINEMEKRNHRAVAKKILTHKRLEFSYEKEVRIFTDRIEYVKVKVLEIIAGKNMPDEEFEFIQKLVVKINPNIGFKKQKNPI